MSFMFQRTPQTDDDYIARLRRTVVLVDRWRPWLRAFYGVLLILLIGLVAMSIQAVRFFMQPGNNLPIFGFGFGLFLGISQGVLIIKIAHGFVTPFSSLRTERLLIHYYDIIQAAMPTESPCPGFKQEGES